MSPNRLSLLLVFTVPLVCAAQVDPVLRAPTAKSTLYLEMRKDNDQYSSTNGKNILYYFSNSYRFPTAFNIDEMEVFTDTLLLMERGKFNLNYRLTNPLRYTVNVNSKEVEDDGDAAQTAELLSVISLAMTAAQKGLAGAVGLSMDPAASSTEAAATFRSMVAFTEADLKAFTSSTGGNTLPGGVSNSDFREKTILPAVKKVKDGDVRRVLLQWLGDSASDARLLDLDTLTRAVIDVETKADNAPVAEIGDAVVKSLLNVDAISSGADIQFEALDNEIAKLDVRNKELSATKSALEKAMAITSATVVEAAVLEDAMQGFRTRLQQTITLREELHKKLGELLKGLKAAKARSADSPSRSVHLVSGDIPLGKQRKLNVKVVEHKYAFNKETFAITTKDTTVIDRSFKLRSTQWLYPRAYAAVTFIPKLTYPEFYGEADSTGAVFIRQKETPASTLSIAAMVNFNIKIGRSPVVPFFQAGAWYKRQQPMLFFGVGARLTTWLALSAGGMQTWATNLNELKIGQEVESQEVINKDLTYEPVPLKFYFGIQFTAPEKKNN